MKRFMLSAVTASLMFGLSHAASAPDFSAIKKDVKILTRIFETAIGGEQKEGYGRFFEQSGVEGMYLANQGMLFTIELPGNNARRWMGNLAPLPPMVPVAAAAPVPAVAPVVAPAPTASENVYFNVGDDEDYDVDLGDIEEYVESVIESTMHGVEMAMQSSHASKAERDALRAKLSALHKAQSEHEKQVEKMQEQIEELEEKSSSEDKAARAKAMEALEKARQNLRKSRESYRNTVNGFRAEQGKRWQEQVVKLQDEVLDTLCNYASSARRIPDNENVTLLFRNVGNNENGEHQVFVLKRADIVSCVTNTQSPGYLRKRALVYST
jgi:hypothetical protein